MKPNLDQVIADFAERELPPIVERTTPLPGLPGKADVVVGMRRSGKTFLLFQQIRRLLDDGVPRDRILYLNFEDERLLPWSTSDLDQVPTSFFRRYPASRGERCWFFFDEIQNVPNWERFVRRLLDDGKITLVLTGSSSRLLSREIATSLRGRSLQTELLPFSFAESLRFGNIEVPKRWPPPQGLRAKLEHHFETYLEVGGFPEVQALTPDLRRRVLRDYIDVVILRDVAERHGVENLQALRALQRSLLSNPAGRFSIHRIHNDLKSQGLRVSKDSLHDYLDYFEEAFLLFTVTIASRSIRVRRSNPRKCYPVDPALSTALSFQASQNTGHLLETLVYLELRRRQYQPAYVQTRSGYEVDFLAEPLLGERKLFQVCADLSSDTTRERELRALEEAMEEYDLDQGFVITQHQTENVDLKNGRQVHIVPAWRWLLEPETES